MAQLMYLVEFCSNTLPMQTIEVAAFTSEAAEQVARNMYGSDIQIYRTNPFYK
jgi:hypothetical protein